jgi:hypothetical protein
MDLVFILMRMGLNILGNGKMINKTGTEYKNGKMVRDIRENM